MGLGDWVLATAEARYYNETTGLPVVFAKKANKQVFWSEVFENNPRILREPNGGQKVCIVENYSGHRPYIDCIDEYRFHFNESFRAEPGELYLTEAEKGKCLPGCVLIEPHTKGKGFSQNKAWPWERWQGLVNSLKLPWVQMGPEGAKTLDGVSRVVTDRYRDALGYINRCSLLVTTDGALHHTAAALKRPAVVLWGGLVSHRMLGYDSHKNIQHESVMCGSVKPCEHCKAAMDSITVEEVRKAVREMC